MYKKLIMGLSMTSLCFTMPVSATIITFSDLNLAHYGKISQDYGDNVNSLNDGVGSYLKGRGFTPNITMSYETTDAHRVLVEDWIEYWSVNYGDLTDVAFPGQSGYFAEITLTPKPGHKVTLNGFDMAGWSRADINVDAIQVLDKNGSILWESNATVVHGAGETHDKFSPNISSDSEITIRWGTNWNIGIDNIDFNESLINPDVGTTLDCVAIYNSDGSLNIPCVNVPDIFGGFTMYKADLRLINSSRPFLFELQGAQRHTQTIEDNECVATYNIDNSLSIPCVNVSNPFGGITQYEVDMLLTSPSSPFVFEVTSVVNKE